jgi:hypothetical protein
VKGDSISRKRGVDGAWPESDSRCSFCARMLFEMMRRLRNGDFERHFPTRSVLSVLSSAQAENGRQQRLERRLGAAGSSLE